MKNKVIIAESTIHSIKKQITLWYSCEWLLYKEDFLQHVKCYHVLLLQVVYQKRKPQNDSLFLSALHILGPKSIVHGDLAYCRLLVLEVTMYSTRKLCYCMVQLCVFSVCITDFLLPATN